MKTELVVTLRKITNMKMAIEQYEQFCTENVYFRNKTKEKETINEKHSYCQKKKGYCVLREDTGWLVAFVSIINGRVYLP